MSKRKSTKEFCQELQKMSIDELTETYVSMIERAKKNPRDDDALRAIIISRREIHERNQDDYFMEKVKDLGERGVIPSRIVLLEHTKYKLYERGETRRDIKRRIEQNTLRPFICVMVMNTVPIKVQARITKETINAVVEMFKVSRLIY